MSNLTVFDVEPSIPNYMKVYDWEIININWWRHYVLNSSMLIFSSCLIYLVMVFLGPTIMKNRSPYEMKGLLTIWNSGLAIFSIMGFTRSLPELVLAMNQTDGFYKSVCVWDSHSYPTAFWMLGFALSKMVELGDTIFIILRKSKLIFLHWFHHLTVLVYVFSNYPIYEPKFRYYMTINYFIHSFMYSYYALMTMGFKISQSCAKVLTICQITQMVVGVTVNVYCLYLIGLGDNCAAKFSSTVFALFLYTSYFILFLNFFKTSYSQKEKSKIN